MFIFLMAVSVMQALFTSDIPEVPKPNPREPVDYAAWINEQFSVRSGHNAASEYLALFNEWAEYRYVPTGWKEEDPRLLDMQSDFRDLIWEAEEKPWSGARFAPVSDFMEQREQARERLVAASRKRYCFFKAVTDEPSWVGPNTMENVSAIRSAMKHLIAHGWGGIGQGTPVPMVENMLTVVRMAHQLKTYDFITRSVANTTAMGAYAHLLEALSASNDPMVLASKYVTELTKNDPPWTPYDGGIGDLIANFSIVQSVGEWDPQSGSVRFSEAKAKSFADYWNNLFKDAPELKGLMGEAKVSTHDWAKVSYQQTLDVLQRWFDAHAKRWKLPYAESLRFKEDQRIIDEANNAVISGIFNLTNSNFWSYASVRERFERPIAMQRAVHCVFALLTFHHRNNRFPGKLDDLEIPSGRSMMLDPFSGQEFRYRVDGDSFTLYSVGPDGDDDGGKHHENWGVPSYNEKDFGDAGKADGDFVFWPVPKKNP